MKLSLLPVALLIKAICLLYIVDLYKYRWRSIIPHKHKINIKLKQSIAISDLKNSQETLFRR